MPKYTKPDVLPVELTLNGQDYTYDNLTYGYYDPYIIDVEPRLIHVDGTTKVTIRGFGFVDSGELKALYDNTTSEITCEGSCTKSATFVDKNHIKTTTFPQATTTYKKSGSSVMWDPVFIEAAVYSDKFTNENIKLWYFEEPSYSYSE